MKIKGHFLIENNYSMEKLNVKDLKQMCREKGITMGVSATKKQLIDRIDQFTFKCQHQLNGFCEQCTEIKKNKEYQIKIKERLKKKIQRKIKYSTTFFYKPHTV